METANGWTPTGNKKWGNRWEAVHTCGYISGFDSRNKFRSNTKKCRGCEWGHPSIRSAMNYHYGVYKYSAEKRNIHFALTRNEFEAMVNSACYYCGGYQNITYKGVRYLFNGVDRIDNKLGYLSGNTRPCCRVCNVAKGSMTEQEFYERIAMWAARMQEPGKVR